jgi:hypothetical protein
MSFLTAIGTIGHAAARFARSYRLLALAALLALPISTADAAKLSLDDLTAVDDSRLAEKRGGFTFRGMEISFGIVIETVINGAHLLRTSFNAESVDGPIVMLNGAPAAPGDVSGDFQLQHAANGGFVLTNGGTKVLHQLGNAGGGIVAAISNSLNGQLIQQQAQLNIGIRNLNTIMGLSQVGAMLSQMGLTATGQIPGF